MYNNTTRIMSAMNELFKACSEQLQPTIILDEHVITPAVGDDVMLKLIRNNKKLSKELINKTLQFDILKKENDVNVQTLKLRNCTNRQMAVGISALSKSIQKVQETNKSVWTEELQQIQSLHSLQQSNKTSLLQELGGIIVSSQALQEINCEPVFDDRHAAFMEIKALKLQIATIEKKVVAEMPPDTVRRVRRQAARNYTIQDVIPDGQ